MIANNTLYIRISYDLTLDKHVLMVTLYIFSHNVQRASFRDQFLISSRAARIELVFLSLPFFRSDQPGLRRSLLQSTLHRQSTLFT